MIGTICVLFVAIVAYGVVQLLKDFNFFKAVHTFGDDLCHRVTAVGAVGLEDGDEQNGIVVFGADNRRAWLQIGHDRVESLRNAPRGGLFVFQAGQLLPLVLKNAENIEFHPHGVSFRGSLLFVVNHASHGDEILVFQIDAVQRTATLVDKAHHELLEGLNDVLAISPTELYATRWENAPSSSLRGVAEALLRLPMMYVAHCTKKSQQWQCNKAVDGLVGPNGISLVGAQVFVAHPTQNAVSVFDRNASDGSLKLNRSLTTASAGDNFFVSSTGRVLLTSHWQSLKFIAHTRDPAAVSPTVVSELLASGQEKMLLLTTKLNAGSVAVQSGKQLLIGAVFEDGLLVCEEQ